VHSMAGGRAAGRPDGIGKEISSTGLANEPVTMTSAENWCRCLSRPDKAATAPLGTSEHVHYRVPT
jgi:hypothetical protein